MMNSHHFDNYAICTFHYMTSVMDNDYYTFDICKPKDTASFMQTSKTDQTAKMHGCLEFSLGDHAISLV